MFATLRTEEKDGEVICISSSNQPPKSGQNHMHFACDGCRAKKLKCSAHRFGCQRCRERDFVCTYSNSTQSKRRRPSRGDLTSSSAESSRASRSKSDAGLEEASYNTNAQVLAQVTAAVDDRPITTSSSSIRGRDQYTHTLGLSSDSSGGRSLQSSGRLSSFSFNNNELLQTSGTSGTLNEVTFQGVLETDFADFGFDDLMDLEMPMPSDGPADRTINMLGAQPEPPSPSEAFSREKRKGSSLSSGSDDLVSVPAKMSPRRVDVRHGRRISSPAGSRHSPYQNHEVSRCRCMGITLGILERIQSHAQITTLTLAEHSLYLLKKSIRQCQVLTRCRSCKPTSKLMTFSILLLEKMVGILEAIAAKWELEMESCSSDKDARTCHGDGCSTDTILIGEYPIDTMRERRDLFGFLILLQARSLCVLQEDLMSTAKKEEWDVHRNTLRPVALKLRDLQETLYEMTMEFPP